MQTKKIRITQNELENVTDSKCNRNRKNDGNIRKHNKFEKQNVECNMSKACCTKKRI